MNASITWRNFALTYQIRWGMSVHFGFWDTQSTFVSFSDYIRELMKFYFPFYLLRTHEIIGLIVGVLFRYFPYRGVIGVCRTNVQLVLNIRRVLCRIFSRNNLSRRDQLTLSKCIQMGKSVDT